MSAMNLEALNLLSNLLRSRLSNFLIIILCLVIINVLKTDATPVRVVVADHNYNEQPKGSSINLLRLNNDRPNNFRETNRRQTAGSNKLQQPTNVANEVHVPVDKLNWAELNITRVKPSWLFSSNDRHGIDPSGGNSFISGQGFSRHTFFDTPILLKTNLGLIEGVRSARFSKHLYLFLGIPYAAAPLGSLRWKAPQPFKKWDGALQATKWPPFCVQPSMLSGSRVSPVHITTNVMNEDCLYLNIWTPTLKQNKHRRRPVMAFIHGGSFQFGGISVDENEGSALALLGDVVVVTFNYRLGVFGFLNGNNKIHSPNNVGLLDQQLALEWIKDNIKAFGGDPQQVTLFGESAGAHSVGLHMISPRSQSLFKRAILQSGVPLSILRSYDVNADSEAASTSSMSSVMLAKRLGCLTSLGFDDSSESGTNGSETNEDSSDSTSNDETFDTPNTNADSGILLTNEVLECMRNFSAAEILNSTGPTGSSVFMPTGEDKEGFFPLGSIKGSYDVYSPKIGAQKEYLIGTNSNEGTFMLHYGMPSIFPADGPPFVSTIEQLKKHLTDNISKNLTKVTSEENPQSHLFKPLLSTKSSILDQFLTPKNSSSSLGNATMPERFGAAIGTLVSDILFVCPSKSLARILVEANRTVYYYNYNHRSSQSQYAPWMGVTHHDEVEFVFGRPLRMADIYTGADIEMSQRMIKTWSHFAYTGTMLPQLELKWPQFELEDDYYMNIEHGKASVDKALHEKFCNIYDNVISIHLQGY